MIHSATRRRFRHWSCLVALAAWPLRALVAQETSAKAAVYLDCRTSCDFDFMRTEITYVNWVRDRAGADVHLLVTSRDAGAGGSEFTLAFIGLRSMANRGDTLIFTTDPTTTSDERRRLLVHSAAMGLMQFVARTESRRTVRITSIPTGAVANEPVRTNDRWRSWVFSIGMNGGLNGEHSYRSREIQSSVQAQRVTEALKVKVTFEHEYRDERATVQEYDAVGAVTSEETFTSLQRNWESEGLFVRSVTGQLSAGVRTTLLSNTFRNYRRALYVAPALEYDLFPYSESTRRELSVQYGAGYQINRYVDMTIYDKLREALPVHYVSVQYRTRQPWGSVSISAEHRNYINDGSKRNTELGGNFDVRLFRGLSVHMGANYNWIRDQIYLPKGEQDQVDVLLRRRALLTGFQYGMFGGLSYTFGSIFNNVVNPRF